MSLVKNNFLWVNPYWLFLMTFLSFICLEMLVPRISFVTLPGMEADQPVVAQVLPTPGACFPAPALESVFWSLLIIDTACLVACLFLFGLLSVSFHQGGFRWVSTCITAVLPLQCSGSREGGTRAEQDQQLSCYRAMISPVYCAS